MAKSQQNEPEPTAISTVNATATPTAKKRIDLGALHAITKAMPVQFESAGDFVRRMRDEDRY